MLDDERGRIQKKRRKATRRAEKEQRERLEAVLCDALVSFFYSLTDMAREFLSIARDFAAFGVCFGKRS